MRIKNVRSKLALAAVMMAVIAIVAATSSYFTRWAVMSHIEAQQGRPPSTVDAGAAPSAGTCGGPGSKGACVSASTTGGAILPVNDPSFGVKECIKQLVLWEDHMFNTEKQCRPCIEKHAYTAEALAEETVTLCDDPVSARKIAPVMDAVAHKLRALHEEFNATHDPQKIQEIAQSVRAVRRDLMKLVAPP